MRKYFESLENQHLAPYALHAQTSKGRTHLEPLCDNRTCYQRDRDRIIHAKAFRRLKHKTQVFITTKSDHYRTRLTHTLEVASISRHLARLLRLNEDAAECMALAHDLGHTPFGHSGERTLNTLLASHGGFEHNQHSYRIVTQLESPYPHFKGLNLSYEITQGLLKHSAKANHPVFKSREFNSLEAQITNMADEIAYTNHDIDDGLSSGILTLESLAQKSTRIHTTLAAINANYTHLSPDQRQHLLVSLLIRDQLMNAVTATTERLQQLTIHTLNDVQSHPTIACYSDDMAHQNKELKKVLFADFYQHPSIVEKNKVGQHMIETLFHYYVSNPQDRPTPLQHLDASDGQHTERFIGDYIAGMTDNYAETHYFNTQKNGSTNQQQTT